MGWDMVERPKWAQGYDTTEIDEDFIQSGDPILILRLNGLDPLISYTAGSHIAHTAMAMRFDGELYVIESQDTWFWPTHNIQKTKFKNWMRYAD